MKKAELLSPAGSLKSMRYAFAYGADAVYAGQPRYSLRVRNNEFTHEKLAGAIEEAHSMGKKLFVASNIIPHNDKIKTYLRDLEQVVEAKPDALIMADPGLIMMVRERWPDLDIHLSVQSNVVNYASVKFWENFGLARIILSRELSLKEVAEIREHCPNIELETFVHGALCMAYSGSCLLSGYMNHRDPNQGACTNACRWKYKVHEGKTDEWGNVDPESIVEAPVIEKPLVEKTFLLEDVTRPGKYMPVSEDEHGTHILNSKDLRAIQHVGTLMETGIDCLKIEGRTKSFFYAARTAQLYRQAIDDAAAGKPFDMTLMDRLQGLTSRGYTEGFYRRHVRDEMMAYEASTPDQASQRFVGEITDYDTQTGMATIDVKNRFAIGDTIEVMSPEGSKMIQLEMIENKKGEKIEAAPGSGHVVKIPLDMKGDLSKGLLINHLVK